MFISTRCIHSTVVAVVGLYITQQSSTGILHRPIKDIDQKSASCTIYFHGALSVLVMYNQVQRCLQYDLVAFNRLL